MDKDFYTSRLEEIQTLIDQGNFNKANDLINEELSMPYIPASFQKEIIKLQQVTSQALQKDSQTRFMSDEEIAECLNRNDESTFQVVALMDKVNIRNYLSLIEDYLLKEDHNDLIASLLIECCVRQHLDCVLSMKHQDQIITFNPADLPEALYQSGAITIFARLDKLFGSDNPSFLKQCQIIASGYLYQLYPKLVQMDDCDSIVYSVVRYVYMAYGAAHEWELFRNKLKINENSLIELSI